MTETTISLFLSQEQRWHLFALLLVYLFPSIVYPSTPGQRAVREQIQEVTYRLVHLDADARESFVFALSSPETKAIKEALKTLQPFYEQGLPTNETSRLALSHLTMYRLLIEEAEHQLNAGRESR